MDYEIIIILQIVVLVLNPIARQGCQVHHWQDSRHFPQKLSAQKFMLEEVSNGSFYLFYFF
jgi:hypothetical protein